jgi:ElaB/YqjD/DUF883 family membrane-anchored ribosome-binding protein
MFKEQLPQEQKVKDRARDEANVVQAHIDAYRNDHPRSKKSDQELAEKEIKKSAKHLSLYKEQGGYKKSLQPQFMSISKAGVRVLTSGQLEISRWDKPTKRALKPTVQLQRVDGINSAIRMQDNILALYRKENVKDDHTSNEIEQPKKQDELTTLDSIQEVVEEANRVLLAWKDASPERKEELKYQLADVVLMLERCRNEFKVKVGERARVVMRGRDSRGRENPSALAATTVGALNDLQKRIDQIGVIAPKIAMRKELLVLEKRRSEKVLEKAGTRLNIIRNHQVFRTGKPGTISDHEVETLKKKTDEVVEMLQEVYVAPYFQVKEQAKYFLEYVLKPYLKDATTVIQKKQEIRHAVEDVQKILGTDVSDMG